MTILTIIVMRVIMIMTRMMMMKVRSDGDLDKRNVEIVVLM